MYTISNVPFQKGTKSDHEKGGNPLQYNKYKIGKVSIYQGNTHLGSYDFIPQDDFQTTLQFELINLFESVMKGAGLPADISNIIGTTAFADADGFSSRFRNTPAQKSFSCTINDSVVLKFRYGLFREFNAQKEVVNPICSIIKLFAPVYNKETHMVSGPYASTLRVLKGAVNSIEDALKTEPDTNAGGKKGGAGGADSGTKQGLITKLSSNMANTISKFIDEYDTVVEDTYLGDKGLLKYLNIQVGKFTWKYIVPKSISWKFDTSNVDEKGNPMSGELTLGGLQFIYTPVQIEGGKEGFFNFAEGAIGDLNTPDSQPKTNGGGS